MINRKMFVVAAVVALAIGAGLLGVGVMRGDMGCWAAADSSVKNTCTVERGAEILRESWQVPNQEMWYRVFAPGTLAPYDPDLAIKIVADEKGNVPDEVRFQVLYQLLESDKAKGIAWGPGQMDKVANPHISIRMLTELGLAAADTDMGLAKGYYERAKQFVGKDGPDPQLMWNGKEDMDYALLAGSAGRIGSDEAEQWVEKLKAFAKKEGKNKEDVDDILTYRAEFVAKGSPALAEKIASGMSKDNALHILANAAAEASFQDKELARKLLGKMEAMGGDSMGEMFYGEAALYVIVAWAPSEPRAMLDIARGIKDTRYKPLAMGLAVPYLTAGEKSKVLREAADNAAVNYNYVPTDLAWLGYLAYDTDPTLARQLFGEAKKQLREATEMRVEDAAAVAYYMRVADPAGARLMLESMLGQADKANPDRALDRENIAKAMAALDIDRALEIARSIPESQVVDRSWTLRKIAAFCLQPAAKRDRSDYLHRMRGEMWMYGGPSPK